MKKVIHIVGARPNFMKVAPIHRAIAARNQLQQVLVHTGQHYDVKMSDVFFSDLGLPAPEVHLGIGSGSHAQQTAKTMVELERVFLEHKPDLVSVVGDVNSTVAAALVSSKLGIALAHVEAGLRSYSRHQPEEINRVVTDRLSDLLLTPSRDADANLLKEGADPERIHFVGNVMIDSLLASKERADQLPVLKTLGVEPRGYAVCTLHRPSNVDDPKLLGGLLSAIAHVASRVPVIFPVHPRTRKMISEQGLGSWFERSPNLRPVDPMGYLEFLALTSQAKLILTDSGGLQEETTALGVPCLTLRENTERPITVEQGTNEVVGTDPDRIRESADRVLDGQGKKGRIPEYWDGRSGERIADLFARFLGVSDDARRAASA
ncbi:UDP-N-acetylglucosamine 2-epimerase (non-hydrolyzing) [Myxococcus sp. MISCRS1]|jgi:UDP-N-acetylglucosamine 2-epimerase (non-hydrolysing)|uniref:non-hydrolyzing UDP-N-acetylglucosamine 2-epimerase n=1 Tax=Myxococcus TaxID=32 RepID=UPI0011433A53|nr:MULTISPECIES: UDP-N-acetylglucosamine 2-epimerase (non-hydrolyzing) [unclassified Myxococcus]MBZ4397693.1 UDP-N-acetylglucosamine 2-epimerase (non-hydrolyzing) [Myxococcus sp. AS-1-15]MBZ4407741.1 UDP-N-acetylglucosamine 2-epimerase (non-hydrolyzing) [Myxococcus sp. XM-1-1-1]MCY0998429.1 UDP-N-acetylglucosamine 2-epimerase (non-hydrolyzing) [Myxococcus sp. MISCRS1]BDT31581.1 UDP-N-acetylglucosamine 2-epimerase (non-hydrolyzing) [Myxococcus sp. MH1]